MNSALGAAIPVAIALVGNRFTQQRTQDDAFQSYLDKMGDLMLDKDSPLSSVEADDPFADVGASTNCSGSTKARCGRKPERGAVLTRSGLIG